MTTEDLGRDDASPVLEVERLSVSYGTTQAVKDVGFEIRRGEIFGMLGPNGAGKTSTLSAIEGLTSFTSGSVRVGGLDVRKHGAQTRAMLGVQLQATSFQPQLTVIQIIELFAGLYGVDASPRALHEQLTVIGLAGEAKKAFKQLSGGQQQRLSLSIALLHDPLLLVLDEPTTGLDPQSRRHLWSRIEKRRDDGGSILLTTHSMEEAQAVCNRVAIIDDGRVLATGEPQQLIERYKDDPLVRAAARGAVTLEDVFIGLTGGALRD